MKRKPLLCLITALAAATSFGGPAKDFKDFKQPAEEDLFKDTELQVDVFSSYGYGENEKITKTVHTFTTKVEKTPVAAPVTTPPPETPGLRPAFRTTVTTEERDGELVTTTRTRHDHHEVTGYTGLFDRDNAFGGGIGATYFFARYFGVGLEGDWLQGGEAIQFVDSSVYARYPINFDLWGARRGLAPYLFTGYGVRFDGAKWGVGHVGAGIEFRLCSNLAVFTDGRFVFGHSDAEAGIWRTGVRVIF